MKVPRHPVQKGSSLLCATSMLFGARWASRTGISVLEPDEDHKSGARGHKLSSGIGGGSQSEAFFPISTPRPKHQTFA